MGALYSQRNICLEKILRFKKTITTMQTLIYVKQEECSSIRFGGVRIVHSVLDKTAP